METEGKMGQDLEGGKEPVGDVPPVVEQPKVNWEQAQPKMAARDKFQARIEALGRAEFENSGVDPESLTPDQLKARISALGSDAVRRENQKRLEELYAQRDAEKAANRKEAVVVKENLPKERSWIGKIFHTDLLAPFRKEK